MIARLVRSVDFERVLRTRTRASSAHFAVHHVPDAPQPVLRGVEIENPQKLSTGAVPRDGEPVDDLSAAASRRLWLGAVVPKRHARRSVTRTLLKRQIRAVVNEHAGSLTGGLWVVRLRAPFDRALFPSAASDALRTVARAELVGLFDAAFERLVARP